ncbi:uncharacterized protein [Euphorbia lathyris]|uniref:uncharacterized protein n=1 Tax=Euphorbia lathyris TaxID=212925 RepID=UPI0033143CC0
MKNRVSRGNPEKEKANGSISTSSMKMKKNITRLGGHGLSLEAFANAKSTTTHYNPALIKQQKELYKNAKFVSKFKRKLKQQNQQNGVSSAVRLVVDKNETVEAGKMIKRKKKRGSNSLRELYEKQQEEKEKERMEREAIIKTRKEAKEKAEAQRKAEKQKMFKRTRRGQPVMKYKIEHLLQIIQASN